MRNEGLIGRPLAPHHFHKRHPAAIESLVLRSRLFSMLVGIGLDPGAGDFVGDLVISAFQLECRHGVNAQHLSVMLFRIVVFSNSTLTERRPIST
jgi:hypothetical protein